MEIRIDEIAPDVFRLSTYVPEIAAPLGFTFNQFVVRGEEPFMFHTGMRMLFPSVSEAVDSLVGLDRLRWISFGHVEADECGAMNQFLAAAPRAEVVHGQVACMVSLNDLADRAPRAVDDGEVLDLGGRRVRFVATPHVPHGWESGLWFEETTGTLLAGDLFGALGMADAVTTDDLLDGARMAEDAFGSTSMGPTLVPTLRRLADLEPTTLALMHGPSFRGDGAAQLRALADMYAERVLAAT
jgi:flavorubredoxin